MNKTARMFGSSKLRSGTATVANGMPQITSRATKCMRSGRARGNVVPLNFASMSSKSLRRCETSLPSRCAASSTSWPPSARNVSRSQRGAAAGAAASDPAPAQREFKSARRRRNRSTRPIWGGWSFWLGISRAVAI